ncbi:MAG: putative metalloprotease with PDZ domain [Polaribacter sp.]|jgi:predicted metalloprotease with PDZ domain
MKNLKTIIAVVAIGLLTVLPTSANTNTAPSKDAKTILRTKIISLLGNHTYDLSDKTLEAQVSVMLNSQNELVVISVSSDSETAASYVKAKLNYKKITVKGISKGTIYIIPIKLIQSS